MNPRIAGWAGLVMLPMVALALTSIWTGDDRWAATAWILFLATILVAAATIIFSEEWRR